MTSFHRAFLFVSVSVLLFAGCSGSPARSSRAPDCPASLPQAGSTCTPDLPPRGGVWLCEYGSDPHCTTVAQCSATSASGPYQWTLTEPDPSCAGNPPACPASFGALANGAACPGAQSCTYPEGRCSCAPCASGAGGQGTEWECEAWQTPAGCPEPRPLLGTACDTEGQECGYGAACCGSVSTEPAMVCNGGYWSVVPVGCDCAATLCGH